MQYVRDVGQYINWMSLRRVMGSFALVIASHITGGKVVRIILMRIVHIAEKLLLKISTQRSHAVLVVALRRKCGEKERVYDLTVDGCHEYFANGILVHNCIDAFRYMLNAAHYNLISHDKEEEVEDDSRIAKKEDVAHGCKLLSNIMEVL